MQISSQPKGWSDAEVDQALGHLEAIEENTVQNGEFIYAVRDGSVMLVFIASVTLGYLFAVNVIPTLSGLMTGKRR